MSFKSLLTTVVLAGATTTAFAFPTITLYPAPGEVDNAQMFDSFNVTTSAPISIVDNEALKPYFDSLVDGDRVVASNFSKFVLGDEETILLNFDSESFSSNGEWELVFPAGCMKDEDGNLNEQITFKYTLSDPNLAIGNYDPITLTSSNPATGANLHSWGEAVGKVTFVTSNDAAVNYIEWTLWDVTKGTEEGVREYITSGNENRFDVNRTGNAEDQWADGLFVVASGDYKLIEGHTYHLAVKFCAIGYDPETNQYPNPMQIEKSTMLDTYLEFHGQTPATVYSPYVVESVTPDPLEYEFIDLDQNSFLITYSGPVKPIMFTTPLGFGSGNAAAGTFEIPENVETVGDGYAATWEFFFDKDILKQAVGAISVTIEAKDQDGLFVQGNGGFEIDNFEYNIDWQANAGTPKLTITDPVDGATLKEISSITISNEAGKDMALAYNAESNPRIIARDGSTDLTLEDPVFSSDNKSATFTFDAITKPGVYTVIIYKGYFNIGDQFEGTMCNQANFKFTIEGEVNNDNVTKDWIPESASIQDGVELTEALTSIKLTFAEETLCDLDTPVPGSLYRIDGDNDVLVEAINAIENDFFNPTEYTYTLATPLSAPGTYKFVVPEGAFYNEDYDVSGKESGRISPELVYNFTIGDLTGVEDIVAENGVATVYDIAGRVVLRDADATMIKTLAAGVYIINGKKYVVK